MAESQNIEWKESWRDEYLKWICGFANAQGGKIYIGTRDAVREAVFNALIHCNWADNVPVQIRIEDDAMFISNCSMLPFGWTAETLLGSHSSKPYNPDIARVFYRAGYIESWGRGIQKIRDACKNLGTDEPEYIVHGEDIMVKFNALQSAKVPNSKASNEALDEALEMRLLKLLKEQPKLTQKGVVVELNISRATMQRLMKSLETSQRIERKGGKRYGYWEVR